MLNGGGEKLTVRAVNSSVFGPVVKRAFLFGWSRELKPLETTPHADGRQLESDGWPLGETEPCSQKQTTRTAEYRRTSTCR